MSYIIPVKNKDIPELRVYACRTEVPLLRCFEPEPGVFVTETPKVIERALDAGYQPLSFLVETKYVKDWMEETSPDNVSGSVLQSGVDVSEGFSEAAGESEKERPHWEHVRKVIARCEGVPVYTADQEFLRDMLGYPLPGGLLCAMRRKALPDVEDICRGARRIVVLENVTNPTNIGTIFRSAAALGMDSILLTRSCSDPLYRRTDRVSMGTVFQVPWTYFDKKTDYPKGAYAKLGEWGFKTAAMVLMEDSVDIDDPALRAEEKLAIVLGSEGEGLEAGTIDVCDYKVYIPMAHGVDSLNVAEAATIAFWELGK